MSKTPKNNGKKWSNESQKELVKLANGNTPTRIIALKLKRTPSSVQSKAQELKISLKPTNQSPYNRRKK